MIRRIAMSVSAPAIFIVALCLANLRGTILMWFYFNKSGPSGFAWLDVGVWAILILLLILAILGEHRLNIYFLAWKENWLLIVFIGLALISSFWSISPLTSVSTSLVLLFSSLIAAYLGVRSNLNHLLDYVFWSGAFLMVLSYSFAILYPKIGTMDFPPYNGAWNGPFWHKNQLGTLTAFFSFVYLLRIINDFHLHKSNLYLELPFYLASLILIYFANSVTGLITAIVLHFSLLIVVLWLKIYQNLRPIHYFLMVGILFIGGFLFFLNLDIVFKLFNRNPSLTGRSYLWDYLIQNVVNKRPWFGYGFDAAWALESFRVSVQHAIGWGFQVMIGDNGFIDILIHLGIVGLLIFAGLLLIVTLRAGQYALKKRNLTSFFPIIFLLYVFLVNISYSLLMQTEFFVYMLLVAIMFFTSPSVQNQSVTLNEK